MGVYCKEGRDVIDNGGYDGQNHSCHLHVVAIQDVFEDVVDEQPVDLGLRDCDGSADVVCVVKEACIVNVLVFITEHLALKISTSLVESELRERSFLFFRKKTGFLSVFNCNSTKNGYFELFSLHCITTQHDGESIQILS